MEVDVASTAGRDWIRLLQKKEFSRLLYPNPVCFLCTPSDDGGGTQDRYQANAMTISWLTATDNEGRFVMSLNKRRYSAKYMEKSGREFCLCVPVAGMETLVLAIGGTSGNFGSKFVGETRSNHEDDEPKAKAVKEAGREDPLSFEKAGLTLSDMTHLKSKNHKKRLEREALRREIPGFVRMNLGGQENDNASNAGLFCIEGTVAHLHCRSYKVNNNEDTDDGHFLIFGEILDAYCKPSYWDKSKKLFCPKSGNKPFLTFFGSQTFGYVVEGSVAEESSTGLEGSSNLD